MRPGSENSLHGSIMEPPKFSNSPDGSAIFPTGLNSSSLGPRRAKTSCSSLSPLPFFVSCNARLNCSHQRQFAYAHCQGLIDYKQNDQVKAVQWIIYIVPVEPPLVFVTLFIDLFNRVSNCMKAPSESLSSFAIRFTGLACEHLMQVAALLRLSWRILAIIMPTPGRPHCPVPRYS